MLYSPLEQFKIIYFYKYKICFIDLSLTLPLLISILIAFTFSLIYYFLIKQGKISFISKNKFFEIIYLFVYNLTTELLKDKKNRLIDFPLVFCIFTYIALCNLIGILPYSYTITSQLVITFIAATGGFFAVTKQGILNLKFKVFAKLLPEGLSFILAFIIVPLEFLSYFIRPISLSIRLFANMMAGHTLLKVIITFIHNYVEKLTFTLILIIIFPILLTSIIYILEFFVACIQAYVFTVLFLIYQNDMAKEGH